MSVSPFLFYLLVGAGLIAIELLVFQLSVFWLLFIGFGALIAALVAWFFPESSWLLATTVFVFSSAIISFLLYSPLKKWQRKPGAIAGNDAIGQSVEVLSAVSAQQAGTVSWSGTDWKAELASGSDPLSEGDTAVITSMEGIRLTVKKKNAR